MQKKIILASGSPRRIELLARMGVTFEVVAADVDETASGNASSVVIQLARRKATAVATSRRDSVILAADTVVDCDGILGKPADPADAYRMLRALSGRWHAVHTGICTIFHEQVRCEVAISRVHFVELTDDDIARYIATGDPMDKAGAYGIQGMAGMFIDEINGCPHNVMGLPMALVKRMLACAGADI